MRIPGHTENAQETKTVLVRGTAKIPVLSFMFITVYEDGQISGLSGYSDFVTILKVFLFQTGSQFNFLNAASRSYRSDAFITNNNEYD